MPQVFLYEILMSNHRMFSNRIANSAKFLQMPAETQLLYFHFVLRADDDGVVEAYPIQKLLGLAPDNLKVLQAKNFVRVLNDDQVIVIMDWLEHNKIRADRKVNSIYKDLLLSKCPTVKIIEPKPRSDVVDNSKRIGGQSTVSVSKVKLSKVKLSKVKTIGTAKAMPEDKPKYNPLGAEIIKAFEGIDPKNKNYYGNKAQRSACDFLISEYGLEFVMKVIAILPKTNCMSYFPVITTPFQLKEKWTNLKSKLEQKKGEKITKNTPNFII